MGCIDHNPVGVAGLSRQFTEYPIEHAQPAPADETIVDPIASANFIHLWLKYAARILSEHHAIATRS